jgi:phosphate transport system protein
MTDLSDPPVSSRSALADRCGCVENDHAGFTKRRRVEVRLRTTFEEQLDLLEAMIQEEGVLVLRVLRGAINALKGGDEELAGEVIAFDDEVDERYLRVAKGVESLFAREAAVGTDLRLLLAILHINLHLERMADYCVTVAKLSQLAPPVDPGARLVEGFEEMGSRCEEMIRVALSSFANRDLGGAESLVVLDELVDRANRGVVERLVDLGDDPATREYGLRMVVASRAIERIGDHAVDIGERVAYLVTGEFREFTDASHPSGGAP